MDKRAYREVLGQRLRAFRADKGLTAYRVAQDGGIRIDQVKAIESGDANYTIDAFLGYIAGSNLYMYFAEKSDERVSTGTAEDTTDDTADSGGNSSSDSGTSSGGSSSDSGGGGFQG